MPEVPEPSWWPPGSHTTDKHDWKLCTSFSSAQLVAPWQAKIKTPAGQVLEHGALYFSAGAGTVEDLRGILSLERSALPALEAARTVLGWLSVDAEADIWIDTP